MCIFFLNQVNVRRRNIAQVHKGGTEPLIDSLSAKILPHLLLWWDYMYGNCIMEEPQLWRYRERPGLRVPAIPIFSCVALDTLVMFSDLKFTHLLRGTTSETYWLDGKSKYKSVSRVPCNESILKMLKVIVVINNTPWNFQDKVRIARYLRLNWWEKSGCDFDNSCYILSS